MDNLNIYNYLSEKNWQLALIIAVVGGAWLTVTFFLSKKSVEQPLFLGITLSNLFIAPVVVVAIGAMARLIPGQLGLESIESLITKGTIIAAYLVLAWLIASVVEQIVILRRADQGQRRLSGLMIGMFRLVCLVIGFAFALAHLDYSITGVWVSTSVAVAVIGFAVQRTLGDLFSGIALSLDRPFALDDYLELNDGTFGRVIDMNWRATRLKGWDNATYVIPNGELANQGFKNYHDDRHIYAPWYEFKVSAEVDPRYVKTLLLEAALSCENVMKMPLPVVRLSNALTIPYTYMVWVHFQNYPAMFFGREELFQEVHFALRRANIQISAEANELYLRKASVPDAKMPSIRLAIKSLDLEGRLTDDDLDEIAERSRYIIVKSGKVILEQGAVAESFDVISSGIVEASLEVTNGVWKSLEQLQTGDVFGIISMMTSEPSEFRFSAMTEVHIIRVDIESVRTLVDRRPGIAETFSQIVRKRMETAESARMAAKKVRRQPKFNEILYRVKQTITRK
jgi:small-conductance mechanosensitive channel/CRP-like cAMP-binding protein